VLGYVMHALMNAKNTLTWNTVNYVLKYVGDALKNAEKWLDTNRGSLSYSPSVLSTSYVTSLKLINQRK
jgi:hypothetical protein